jgi:PAS domain S-box-containing protein
MLEESFRQFVKLGTDGFSLYDKDLNLVEISDGGMKMLPPGIKKKDLIGKNLTELVPAVIDMGRYIRYFRVLETGEPVVREMSLPKAFGKMTHISLKAFKVDNYLGLIITDISKHKQTENALRNSKNELRKHRDHLEELVKERTANLEEANAALRVLLKKREEDRTELEEKVLFNVKELITPYMGKMKKSSLTDRQHNWLEIVDSNLNDIISPFIRGISLKYLNLTPAEIQVANFVKQGRTSKEIAQILNMSPRTIDAHRYNIRKKMGLKNKNDNLRTYLLAIQ